MLKVQFVEIFLRGIPEMLLVIWGIYVIARKPIKTKSYMFSSIIMGFMMYFARMLPIYFGAHTFINIILLICVVCLNGIDLIKAIYGSLFMFLMLALSEFINAAILDLLNIGIETEFLNPIKKSALGIPSLVITSLLIIIINFFIKKRENLKKVAC